MLRLRAHHLICLRLFLGLGYDEVFTAKMQEVCDIKNHSVDEQFMLVNRTDDICAACPNQTAVHMCALGEEDACRRDGRAMEALALTAGGKYSFRDIDTRMRQRMTRERFEAVCAGCRWHEERICSFDGLKETLYPH